MNTCFLSTARWRVLCVEHALHISEVVTGLVGAVLITLSVISSIFYRRKPP